MKHFLRTVRLNVPVEAAFSWHARPGAFERLAPPWETMHILRREGTIRDGDRMVFELVKWPLRLRWDAEHSSFIENRQFADTQRSGPFAHWYHVHRFEPADNGSCALTDDIEYRLPLGRLGKALGTGKVSRDLDRLFTFRHGRVARDLERQQAFATRPPLRIAIAGASGLIGSALVPFLTTAGHQVMRLVRRPVRDSDREIFWKPSEGKLDSDALEGFDAVIHLGGVSIATRWTDNAKQAIRDSRVDSTRLLAEALASCQRKPRVLLCASATGFYGNHDDQTLTEDTPAGSGFLPEVCQAWEAAADAARDAGIRVVHLRNGVVLSPKGGALAKMLPAFQFGVGGKIGDGRQYMSWIALDDVVGAMWFLLNRDDLDGPFNLTAPEPATNRDFTTALGRVLHRPTVLPAPAPLIRLALGEMGQTLLVEGARVVPQRLLEAGFAFVSPTLEDALRWELGRLGPAA